MLLQNLLAKWINLAKRDGFKSARCFKAKGEPTYAAE